MRCLVFMLLLLFWAHSVCAQIVDYSADLVEQEDSLRTLSIKPVRKPKKLLRQVMNRLQLDLKQKHGERKYKIEAMLCIDTFPSFSANCICRVCGDNGLEIIDVTKDVSDIKIEDICFKGPYGLTDQDSVNIKCILVDFLNFSPICSSRYFYARPYPYSPIGAYEAERWFNVKAYKITYGSDDSIYRIDFIKNKNSRFRYGDRVSWFGDYSFTAFFDCRTLRITRYKGESYDWDKAFPLYSSDFQVDYEVDNGAPILNQLQYVGTFNNIKGNALVRRIE